MDRLTNQQKETKMPTEYLKNSSNDSFNDEFITEAYIKSIMGSRYLGYNVVLCGYCLQEELEFTDIFQDYKCNACKEAYGKL